MEAGTDTDYDSDPECFHASPDGHGTGGIAAQVHSDWASDGRSSGPLVLEFINTVMYPSRKAGVQRICHLSLVIGRLSLNPAGFKSSNGKW